jgi:ABC-type multidrug transport system fused ATPase/permease subunit
LVLKNGLVEEFGSPVDLIENSAHGHFRKMCEDTGEFEELLKIAIDKVKGK